MNKELGLSSQFCSRILAGLGQSFSLETLREVLAAELQRAGQAANEQLEAQSTVAETQIIYLALTDQRTFADALDGPPKLAPALRRARETYREFVAAAR